MALLWRSVHPSSSLQLGNLPPIPMRSLFETLILRKNAIRFSSVSFFPSSNRRSSAPCDTLRFLASNSSMESGSSPSARVFVKGLGQSTSEGSLVKAFSHFGEVVGVKILTDMKSGQSLGLAYIWFATEDSAELAVKEMNGKFFDGRFIFVTIARFGPSKRRRRATPYKF